MLPGGPSKRASFIKITQPLGVSRKIKVINLNTKQPIMAPNDGGVWPPWDTFGAHQDYLKRCKRCSRVLDFGGEPLRRKGTQPPSNRIRAVAEGMEIFCNQCRRDTVRKSEYSQDVRHQKLLGKLDAAPSDTERKTIQLKSDSAKRANQSKKARAEAMKLAPSQVSTAPSQFSYQSSESGSQQFGYPHPSSIVSGDSGSTSTQLGFDQRSQSDWGHPPPRSQHVNVWTPEYAHQQALDRRRADDEYMRREQDRRRREQAAIDEEVDDYTQRYPRRPGEERDFFPDGRPDYGSWSDSGHTDSRTRVTSSSTAAPSSTLSSQYGGESTSSYASSQRDDGRRSSHRRSRSRSPRRHHESWRDRR